MVIKMKHYSVAYSTQIKFFWINYFKVPSVMTNIVLDSRMDQSLNHEIMKRHIENQIATFGTLAVEHALNDLEFPVLFEVYDKIA